MRFMMIVKASEQSEAGVLPTQEQLAEMAKFNEELVESGVMLAGDGLQPSSKGARVKFSGATPTVLDGPFSETKELIAGFWIIRVDSLEEAIAWAKRVPFGRPPFEDEDDEIEIRQLFELEDFGPGEGTDRHAQLKDQLAEA
ncbi:MAG: YciI family protein [Longimicrobiales bacterium]